MDDPEHPQSVGATKASLHDVSCAAANDCWAVGESQESGKEPTSLAERWNGSAWTIQAMPEPTKGLSTISCSSTTWCMAVGDGLGVERWNGSAWAKQIAASPGGAATLKGIFCKSASACTAVGEYTSQGTAPLAERWDGADGRYRGPSTRLKVRT